MANPAVSEWLEIMLEEIERRKAEEREALEEAQRRAQENAGESPEPDSEKVA